MKPFITILSPEQLERKNTKNLLFILKAARRAEISFRHTQFCTDCYEYHDFKDPAEEIEYKAMLKKHEDYFESIKSLLASREHVERVK